MIICLGDVTTVQVMPVPAHFDMGQHGAGLCQFRIKLKRTEQRGFRFLIGLKLREIPAGLKEEIIGQPIARLSARDLFGFSIGDAVF